MLNISNDLGMAIGVLPAFAVLMWIKSNAGKPWCFSNFLASIALIGIAIVLFNSFLNWEGIYELLKAKGEISVGEHEKIKSSSASWLALFPAIFGGIGVNVFSEWLLSKRPA